MEENTGTLAIKMHLGKHNAYTILNLSQAPSTAAALSCCNRESAVRIQNVCAKLSSQHRYLEQHRYTLRTRNSIKNWVQS